MGRTALELNWKLDGCLQPAPDGGSQAPSLPSTTAQLGRPGSQGGSHLLNHSTVQFPPWLFLCVNPGPVIKLTLKRGQGGGGQSISLELNCQFPTVLGFQQNDGNS